MFLAVIGLLTVAALGTTSTPTTQCFYLANGGGTTIAMGHSFPIISARFSFGNDEAQLAAVGMSLPGKAFACCHRIAAVHIWETMPRCMSTSSLIVDRSFGVTLPFIGRPALQVLAFPLVSVDRNPFAYLYLQTPSRPAKLWSSALGVGFYRPSGITAQRG